MRRLNIFRRAGTVAGLWVAAGALSNLAASAQNAAQPAALTITIDAQAATKPFPHFWEQMFGSGRAVLSMRESYRNDLRDVQKVSDFKYVRFHAILHDELGVYDEDAQGRPIYNFQYVDQIYDGLLANHVRPFVEISFMPKKLASRLDYHAFWYKQVVSPPKDYARWEDLMTHFAQHLIDRYGIAEVSQWYFEVWNEPNIDFWTGRPAQQTYFELYDHTARALKAVNSQIRVGGPSTAQAAWVDAMIAHATQNNVPLDFVSTHVYGNDMSSDVFGTDTPIPPYDMVCRAVDKVHQQILASARPEIPLLWSEFNATYKNLPEITDTVFMGPWLAQTISQCDGKVTLMSYWSFSDVFEEQGVISKPFYGGFGVMAQGGIPKPAYDVFALLHQLGTTRIAADADDVLVTKKADGTLVIAAWNKVAPNSDGSAPGSPRQIQLRFSNLRAKERAYISRVDQDHGDTLRMYQQMGSPQYPTAAQVQKLRDGAKLAAPEVEVIRDNTLPLTLPVNGLALVEVRK